FKVHVVDAGGRQGVAERLGAWSFNRADSKKEHFDLAVERCRFGEGAVAGRLGIEGGSASTESAAAAAETTQVREFIQVAEYRGERLRAAHRETRHRAILFPGAHAIGAFDRGDQVGEH